MDIGGWKRKRLLLSALGLVLAVPVGFGSWAMLRPDGSDVPVARATTPPTAASSARATTPTAAPAPVSTAAHPVVDGSRIVDDRDGSVFVPRGVNWSSFEYACTQGWGYSTLDRLGGSVAGVDEAKAIASWGANIVRLPVNQDCWLGTRGAPVSEAGTTRTAAEYRANIHQFIDDLNAHGLVVILDLQSRKRIDQDEFGNVAMPDLESLDFWRSAAAEYASDPSVIFDAFNEPYSRYDHTAERWALQLTWECWRDGGCAAPVQDDKSEPLDGTTYTAVGMAAVVSAIRDSGAKQPIMLGGLDYANDLSNWLDHAPRDPQLIASFHSYPFKECKSATCWDTDLLRIQKTVPVITGEVGDDSTSAKYVKTYTEWAKSHGIGWLAWVWDDSDGNAMALLDHDRSTPTRPYGIRVQQLLRLT